MHVALFCKQCDKGARKCVHRNCVLAYSKCEHAYAYTREQQQMRTRTHAYSYTRMRANVCVLSLFISADNKTPFSSIPSYDQTLLVLYLIMYFFYWNNCVVHLPFCDRKIRK